MSQNQAITTAEVIIDSRDVIARIESLESERDSMNTEFMVSESFLPAIINDDDSSHVSEVIDAIKTRL